MGSTLQELSMYVYVCNKSKRHEKLPSESSVCLKQSGGGAVAQSKPKHHTWFGLGHPKHHHSHAGVGGQAPLGVGTDPPQAPLSRTPPQNWAAPAAGYPNPPLLFSFSRIFPFLSLPLFFFFSLSFRPRSRHGARTHTHRVE